MTKPLHEPDPLYVIFEQHLYSFQDSDADRKTFVGHVVLDYIKYLRKMNIIVPQPLEAAVVEELATTVNTMLVKKIYGALTIQEHREKTKKTVKSRATSRYQKLTR